MAQSDEQPKVSTFYRVLAWVFVICVVVAIVGRIMSGKPSSLSWAEIVLGAMGFALIGPSAFMVALTGRPPRWWAFVDQTLDIEKALKRRGDERDKR
jgi:hypothetical protein